MHEVAVKISRTFTASGSLIAFFLLLLTAVSVKYFEERINQSPISPIDIKAIPYKLGSWEGKDMEGLGVRSTQILKLDDYIRRIYLNPVGQQVTVYIGYWHRQSGEYQAAKHSPAVCLPSNGWEVKSLWKDRINSGGDNELVIKKLLGSFERQSSMFYYWFFSGEDEYAEEWWALAQIGLEKFLRNRSDGGIVEIGVPIGSAHPTPQEVMEAEKIALAFVSEFYPALHSVLKVPEHSTEKPFK